MTEHPGAHPLRRVVTVQPQRRLRQHKAYTRQSAASLYVAYVSVLFGAASQSGWYFTASLINFYLIHYLRKQIHRKWRLWRDKKVLIMIQHTHTHTHTSISHEFEDLDHDHLLIIPVKRINNRSQPFGYISRHSPPMEYPCAHIYVYCILLWDQWVTVRNVLYMSINWFFTNQRHWEIQSIGGADLACVV